MIPKPERIVGTIDKNLLFDALPDILYATRVNENWFSLALTIGASCQTRGGRQAPSFAGSWAVLELYGEAVELQLG